jgi:hypothetical protein
MLSKEQRLHVDNFAFRNGMRNVCFISGIAREVGEKSGYVLQTKNDNLKIPFIVDKNGTIPPSVREGRPVKIIGRLTGMILKGKDGEETKDVHRVAVVKVLYFEEPSILEMPAQECWEMSVPRGAPEAKVLPKGFGLPRSKSSNVVQVAGFVGGVVFRKEGVPGPDGKRKGACIHVLIRQTKNPYEAIPVRIYGPKITKEYEKIVKLGMPVKITQGDLRVDVKETGGEEIDGIAEVSKMPYIRSTGLFVATRDDIKEQPEWALALALQGREKKAAGGVVIAGEGGNVVESGQRTAIIVGESARDQGAGDLDELSVDSADIEAVMKQVGQLPKSPAVVG